MTDARIAFAAAQAAHAAGRLDEAERGYRAVLADEPNAIGAWANLSGVLLARGDALGAETVARRALALAPDLIATHLNLIAVQHAHGGFAAAAAVAAAALALGLRDPALHYAVGIDHDRAGRWRDARAAYDLALTLDPDHGPALSEALYLARCCGDFSAAALLGARFRAALAAGVGGLTPFVFLAERATPTAQRALAAAWISGFGPAGPRPPWPHSTDGRITLGYASSDFHDHPTVHLLAAVLERHDRSRFRVVAYSWGPDDGSTARARVRAACDEFVELRGAPSATIAARIRADRVQLLVDLKGHTADARPELFLARPAPVQINWLGYPGTLGSAVWDAVIGDPIVTPIGCEADYAERVMRLPDCYQPNDPARPHPDPVASRAALGLPADAVVLCCFNAAWKIDAARFADWMEVLRAVPDAVLWLLDANPGQDLAERLRAEATRAGVAAERLVFAPRVPHAEYLARYRHADLFLDTFPYGAHTTASDALWQGCPVLTETGTNFATRVATSALHALGLPELALATRERFVTEAIALARDRGRLQRLRATLETRRLTTPLFDASSFTSALEDVYRVLADAARGPS